jgi:HlyD family secretion protein
VTYETVLDVDNSDLSLRPGMTATADILVESRSDVILVPNAAIRFTPPPTAGPASSGGSLISQLLPRPPRPQTQSRNEVNPTQKQQRVWMMKDGNPLSIPITIGATNGIMTEVVEGEVQPGMQLLVEIEVAEK